MNKTVETGLSVPLAVASRELARLLGVSVRHVERMDASGRLPRALRLGRAKRWSLQEIRAWLAAGCPGRGAWREKKGGAA